MSDPPQLQPYTTEGEKAVLQKLARSCNAIFLGEHYLTAKEGGKEGGEEKDQILAARIVEELQKYKPKDAKLTLGLEMVQQKFQPALDAYIASPPSSPSSPLTMTAEDEALKVATEWDARNPSSLPSSSSFASYIPLLHFAREKKIKLLALGLESEAISKVREVGLEGLSEEERGRYVLDPGGFISSVKGKEFKLYAERFIIPGFVARAASTSSAAFAAAATGEGAPVTPPAGGGGRGGGRREGGLSPAKFLAARILWDESMASAAVRHLQQNPKDLIVLLVGAEHIKFGMGAPARLERLLASAQVPTATGRGQVKSILLNPSPQDSGSETKRLRLTLGYANNLEKCRPLADYLWWSDYPKVAWLEHPQNPISTPYSGDDTLFQVFSGVK
ncbi:iron-regulated protein [Nannochloropsis oceanica]